MPERRALDFFHTLNRLLADEFQRHMQRFRTDPAGVRREAAHAFDETLNALADGVVDVEGNEDSHLALSRLALSESNEFWLVAKG